MKHSFLKNIFFFSGLVLFTGTIFSACQKTASPATSSTPAQTQTTSSVRIQNFTFTPNNIQVKTGQSVTWTNDDTTAHTITSDNGTFDSGNVGQNGSFSFTFTKAGTYNYHCAIHPSMTGQVVVTD